MDRSAMIDKLVDSDYAFIGEFNFNSWYELILRNGFIGYNNMTDKELKQELDQREIEYGV